MFAIHLMDGKDWLLNYFGKKSYFTRSMWLLSLVHLLPVHSLPTPPLIFPPSSPWCSVLCRLHLPFWITSSSTLLHFFLHPAPPSIPPPSSIFSINHSIVFSAWPIHPPPYSPNSSTLCPPSLPSNGPTSALHLLPPGSLLSFISSSILGPQSFMHHLQFQSRLHVHIHFP